MWKALIGVLVFAGLCGAREQHALWVHPQDAGGTSAEGVKRFVDQAKRAHIDEIVLLMKGMNGELYFPSRKFPQAVVKGYDSFDLLDHVIREAHAVGVKVDAWMIDFAEGETGAFREHPEWAQLNPDGAPTNSEKLGKTRPYPYVWMCPARRPGYADQWLMPLWEEVATRYKIDGMHHDYVRYPGDVAPDSYCFCDYCLRRLPRYALLQYESRAGERYRVNSVQQRIEANWWSEPTMLPAAWTGEDRREQADFLLNGRTIPGGPPDLRYFFYEYRVDQIKQWVQEVHDRIKSINPKIEISAAVFRNPIQSARFIGQKWSDWMDVYMPMTYRSHFAGSFDSYLDHLEETTRRQMEWTHQARPIYAGVATTYLYREELKPFDDLTTTVEVLKTKGGADAKVVQAMRSSFGQIQARLTPIDSALARRLESAFHGATTANADAAALDNFAKQLASLRNDPPVGFFPPEKLTRSIEAARKASPSGIAIFAAGSVSREKLWPTLEAAFRDQ